MPRAPKQKSTAEKSVRRSFRLRGKQQSASIYFLLWTIFAAFILVVVLLFGVSQQILLRRTYKEEAARDVSDIGVKIEEALQSGPPDAFGKNNYNGYVRFLGELYDVHIAVLDGEGNLLFPKDPNFDTESPEYKEHYDFTDEIARLLAELEKKEGKAVIYEGDGEYVYGAKITLYDRTVYLHVGESLQLMQTAVGRMRVRTVLLACFLFILTFALSSAVAGWVVTPITEMTDKAQRLAQGDFEVDFHGTNYGKEMVELADTLNFARDELSKTDRMQKELIANVSHDFKTPLTMIKGYASMIIEISGNNPEKRNKHAQIIVDEADRLASLVNDVLDLSKIRSGIAQLESKEIDMSAYLQEVLGRFAYLKDGQGYRFETDIEEGLYTVADEVKIGQVLYNLIGNAVNYTGEDKRVLVSLKGEGEVFRFAVTDTGAGIKEEELADIWDRYYRSSEAHKRPVQGTGLGLSIVKTILERHGFRFGVESEPEKGSTFFVLFPLVKKD
jgi:signal transduction histidine kinase